MLSLWRTNMPGFATVNTKLSYNSSIYLRKSPRALTLLLPQHPLRSLLASGTQAAYHTSIRCSSNVRNFPASSLCPPGSSRANNLNNRKSPKRKPSNRKRPRTFKILVGIVITFNVLLVAKMVWIYAFPNKPELDDGSRPAIKMLREFKHPELSSQDREKLLDHYTFLLRAIGHAMQVDEDGKPSPWLKEAEGRLRVIKSMLKDPQMVPFSKEALSIIQAGRDDIESDLRKSWTSDRKLGEALLVHAKRVATQLEEAWNKEVHARSPS
ncbi:hypothetical protein BDQ12DRAFT_677903 [Crucibulum laeve]|uniref:Uncharacterized protein n=1 Tax=Crucibulum laeve TaxID=68775 RepID=A0A5C3MM97_9AGAR|nr:hypothetical protein BDQ12DRAFT_677903 [Crucibulum laeve]